MDKYGLVLEGGGVRGSFTAGALTWLYDHGVTFDYSVGISSGALYLSLFELGRLDAAKDMACKYAPDPENVGIRALISEGNYVASKHIIRTDILEKSRVDVTPLIEHDVPMDVGVYDLTQGKTIYFPAREIDPEMELIRAACSLPVASSVVDWKGHRLLDGGITKMIPIERALEEGCTKTLVITTKARDYVRKPANLFVRILMKLLYRECPQIEKDYQVRHINYYEQMDLIHKQEEAGNCILVCPSKNIKVSRWKGDPEKCQELFDLGYQDMENRKEEILAFMGAEHLDLARVREKEKVTV